MAILAQYEQGNQGHGHLPGAWHQSTDLLPVAAEVFGDGCFRTEATEGVGTEARPG